MSQASQLLLLTLHLPSLPLTKAHRLEARMGVWRFYCDRGLQRQNAYKRLNEQERHLPRLTTQIRYGVASLMHTTEDHLVAFLDMAPIEHYRAISLTSYARGIMAFSTYAQLSKGCTAAWSVIKPTGPVLERNASLRPYPF